MGWKSVTDPDEPEIFLGGGDGNVIRVDEHPMLNELFNWSDTVGPIDSFNGRVFVSSFSTSSDKNIVEIDPNDLSQIGSIYDEFERQCGALTNDGEFLYAGDWDATLNKIDISDQGNMVRVESTSFQDSTSQRIDSMICRDNNLFVIVNDFDGGYLFKLDKSDLSEINDNDWDSGLGDLISFEGKLFLTIGDRLAEIDDSNLNIVDEFQESDTIAGEIEHNDEYLFVSFDDEIKKIDPSNLSEVDTVSIPDSADDMTILDDNLFVVSDDAMYKIDTNNMTRNTFSFNALDEPRSVATFEN